ncbi:MAG: TonB-dependent receptor [Proteobacteria bacterium]|nr:TonB-dependent receptor [Pseudomonadota bacterium]
MRVKNAGKASIAGAELELTWLPAGHLALHLGYGYLRARFDDFLVGTLASGEIRRDGYHLPHTPRHSLNAAASYSIPLPDDGRIRLQAEYAWNDEQFLESSNLPRTFQDAYAVFNASVAWISPDESWKVTAWGKNLGDELTPTPATASWAPPGPTTPRHAPTASPSSGAACNASQRVLLELSRVRLGRRRRGRGGERGGSRRRSRGCGAA